MSPPWWCDFHRCDRGRSRNCLCWRVSPAAGALKLAGFMLVHAKADEEFAELCFDVAFHGDRDAIAIKPKLFDCIRTFQRLALFFIQPQVEMRMTRSRAGFPL